MPEKDIRVEPRIPGLPDELFIDKTTREVFSVGDQGQDVLMPDVVPVDIVDAFTRLNDPLLSDVEREQAKEEIDDWQTEEQVAAILNRENPGLVERFGALVAKTLKEQNDAHQEELVNRDQSHRQELEARDTAHQQEVAQLRQDIDDLRNQVQAAEYAAQQAEAAAHAAEARADAAETAAQQAVAAVQASEQARARFEADLRAANAEIARLRAQPTQIPRQRRWWNPLSWFGRRQRQEIQPEADALEAYNPDGAALDNFYMARNRLVEVTDRRKARSIFQIFRRRRERDEYNEAWTAYNQELEQVLTHRRNQALTAGVNVDDIEIAQRAFIFNNRLELAQMGREFAQHRVTQLRGWRGRIARGLRRWAEVPTIGKMGVSAGVAALIALGATTFGLGIGAIIAGLGIKMSMAYVNREANVRNVSQARLKAEQIRIQQARQRAANVVGDTALTGLMGRGEQREIKRHRIVNGLGILAVAAGGGTAAYGVATMIDGGLPHIDSILGGGHEHEVVSHKPETGTGHLPEVGPGKASPEALANTHVEPLHGPGGVDYAADEVRLQNGYHVAYAGLDAEGDPINNLVDPQNHILARIGTSQTGAIENSTILQSGMYHGPNEYFHMHTLHEKLADPLHWRETLGPQRTITTLLEKTDELSKAA